MSGQSGGGESGDGGQDLACEFFRGHVANIGEVSEQNHTLVLPSRYEGGMSQIARCSAEPVGVVFLSNAKSVKVSEKWRNLRP